jgi:inorganic pyrophosphatase
MNLWHDVPRGENCPQEMNVIIEIPKGSYNKYEIDKETGLIALDRVNYSAAPYPFDYGYVPQTLWEDGDALDVIVLTTYPLSVGIQVAVRPIGVMEMIDSGESDYKVIAVPVKDKHFEGVNDIADANQHLLKEFAHFFQTYKVLKGKGDVVDVGAYKGKDDAIAAVNKSIELYKQKFAK